MKKLYIPFFTLTFTILYTTAVLWAQEEEEEQQLIQEVFQTELVYPQEAGEFQVTVMPRLDKSETSDLLVAPLILEYGITDSWQLEFEWNSFVSNRPDEGGSTSGVGDIEFGSKYSFMDIADQNFHAALGFEVCIPLADEEKGLGEGSLEYEPYILLAKDIPGLNHSQVFTQLAAGFSTGNEAGEVEEESYSLAWNSGFFIPLGDLRLTTEFNWYKEGDEYQAYITPGLVLDLPGTWEFGIGLPIGLTEESDNYRAIGMLTYEINLFGDVDD